MFNEVTLIGNLGRDPEIKSTPTGKLVANFSIATSTGSADKKKTEWHRCVAWEKSAEILQKYISKGTLVFVRGELRTRKWQDKEGKDRYSTEVVIGGWGTSIRALKLNTDGTAGGKLSASNDDIPWDEDGVL